MSDTTQERQTEFDRRSREAAADRGEHNQSTGVFARIGRNAGRMRDAIPGYTGYRAKEDRRDADRRVRDHLFREFGRQTSRVERVARDLADQRRIMDIGPVDDFAKAIRHLADRINTASYGYGGLFSDRDIDERALDQLRLFDESLLSGVTQLDEPIAALEKGMTGGDDLSVPAREGRDVVTSLNERFDTRGEVVESGTPQPEESVRALVALDAPDEGPPAGYRLDDGDALSILGDNFLVDARLDFAAGAASFRLFRIAPSSGDEHEWLLVPAEPGISLARLRDQPDPGSPPANVTTLTFGQDTYHVAATASGQAELVGPHGVSGYRPVTTVRLTKQGDRSTVAILLNWGNERQLALGAVVHPDDLEIYGEAI